ncbi:hypothetical protein CJF31_00008931 [Rutstroemia sp. NJR-2017a BVV2]|nr:hypothetical protein CJF31_00008931 [Rutstroemia sp. NJR-2017a BVV2]
MHLNVFRTGHAAFADSSTNSMRRPSVISKVMKPEESRTSGERQASSRMAKQAWVGSMSMFNLFCPGAGQNQQNALAPPIRIHGPKYHGNNSMLANQDRSIKWQNNS